jgi:hypothetical protein
MNTSCQIVKAFALTLGVMASTLGVDTVQAQTLDVDLLQPMGPSRPTVTVPGGATTAPAPTPTIPLGVLPGHTITPLPDPGFDTLPPSPEPPPRSD